MPVEGYGKEWRGTGEGNGTGVVEGGKVTSAEHKEGAA